ncbi:hypothetical protein SBDP1_1580007 [Syntrophobacter sp. SbD1]|nr:hypothetical protein SBDP1_1580007 [Syntrophobacter sp. SbD1]
MFFEYMRYLVPLIVFIQRSLSPIACIGWDIYILWTLHVPRALGGI